MKHICINFHLFCFVRRLFRLY